MVTIYQFESVWGINLSPFCRKVETYCQLAGINYTTKAALPFKAPLGKLPFIIDTNQHNDNADAQAIPDSSKIITYLQHEYSNELDADITVEQHSLGHLIQQTCEHSLYFTLLYSRWIDERFWPDFRQAVFGDLPPVVRNALPRLVQRSLNKALNGHGYGRMDRTDIYAIAEKDIDALAAQLDQHDYAVGNQVSSYDATLFAFLASLLDVPLETPTKQHLQKQPSLMAYVNRMRALVSQLSE